MPTSLERSPELAAVAPGRVAQATCPAPRQPEARLDFPALSALPLHGFVQALSGVLEYAPQLIERTWEKRPFESAADLYGQLMEELHRAPEAEKRQLLAAHGDLGDALGLEGHLSLACLHEQRAAGLHSGPMAEREKLHELSARYRRRFGFPCLIALQPLGRGQVIRTLARRLRNNAADEFAENLRQLGLIASYRLQRRCTPPRRALAAMLSA